MRAKRNCDIKNCTNKYVAKGYCKKHYDKFIYRVINKIERKIYERKYRETEHGYIIRTFERMKARVNGKRLYWKGLFLLPQESFYEWSINNKDFHKLFESWTNNAFDKKLSPSINRIDNKKGYSLNNIEWITHSENSSIAKKG